MYIPIFERVAQFFMNFESISQSEYESLSQEISYEFPKNVQDTHLLKISNINRKADNTSLSIMPIRFLTSVKQDCKIEASFFFCVTA